MTLIQTVSATIKEQSLIKKGDHVLIGASGGADSLCLAYVLNEIKHTIGFNISLAHFNHNLRNSSFYDAECVQNFADKYNIKLHSESWKNPPKNKDGNIEEKSRLKRQSFFDKLVLKYKFTSVALAHHKQDAAETILMKLLRGTGGDGLSGIQIKRKINNSNYIRPLLNTSKTEILNFIETHQIKYVEDPSNIETKFLRNKIRHELIPHLKKFYNPNIEQTLLSTALICHDEFDFADSYANKFIAKHATFGKSKISINRREFNKLHPAIKRIVIRNIYAHLIGNTNALTFSNIEDTSKLLKSVNLQKSSSLPKRVTAHNSAEKIIFSVNS